ncbi:NAD-dependent epimerase/dehydratase family protein [Acinetobacter johnsonii]|uniref:NAD-dependent epimerase/dehydratase family protein n=1 Tax=Acinetobacter johnsonii TaxID=40214 RepID=UPI00191D3EAE|nr:NAD-dependent epimerase/dehydratase family protein [Acinetobacter johnsonii]QQV10599.1 GDP-mannose 4,6-dehydratase [Acinetobacter johnsonii]UBQ37771.1 NAD-dependent epimerase/dehydratase family protein [Acinetobacter johnsonii]
MKILVTGAAGFVGYHSSKKLLKLGYSVVGIDNLNDYYDVNLKYARLDDLKNESKFSFIQMDLADRAGIAELFQKEKFNLVLHLGAQAGVRYSIENPFAYLDSNIVGTLTILEGCRNNNIEHLVYASSSSVYGANTKQPFSIDDRVDSPISLYAATKKSDEMMCYTYAHLYGFPITGLRFFTVYGTYGRPDMAYFKFANAIRADKPIDVYNHGDMKRDFTYIDDIVNGIVSIVEKGPIVEENTVPHRVYNLGNNNPEKLLDMINILENKLGKVAVKNYLPMQPGDVYSTFADISATQKDYNFSPKVTLEQGLDIFVNWYKRYYQC